VLELRETGKVPQIIVSQAHQELVRELFELYVPEIEDGTVEIKSIAREAGYRTKIAVHSEDADVDPVGACIGTRGVRIQNVVAELRNEKIDVIPLLHRPCRLHLQRPFTSPHHHCRPLRRRARSWSQS
jgi:N utilization substance protein A